MSDGIASSDGSTALQTYANGQVSDIATDEKGRQWIRLYVDGAPVAQANPLPVSIGGSSGALEVQGDVANDAVDSGNPVKIGGIAESLAGQSPAVAVGDRVNGVFDVNGRAQVALAGGNNWTKFNTALAVPATTFAVSAVASIVGSIEITLDEATDMYALVYDGTDATGTLVGRFFIPASGTSVRDYSTLGGLSVGTGCFVALTTDAGAVTAPATGGFCHAVYQAV